jgi:hypothetical protein
MLIKVMVQRILGVVHCNDLVKEVVEEARESEEPKEPRGEVQ